MRALRAAGLSALIAAAGPAAAEFDSARFRPPPLTLIDQTAAPRDLGGLFAQGPLVMTFAYTTCETICPLGTAVMAELDAAAPVGLTLVTVTIDPARDTPARMARAAAEAGASPRWLWLTGGREEIRRLLAAVEAPVGPLELHDPIFVIADPATGLYARSLTLPTAEEILRRIPD